MQPNSAAGPGRCWSRAGAPAATSPPSPANWRATAAVPRSRASCWSARSPTAAFDRPSYTDNATGYFLTRSLMYWFWDLYCSPADRTDPRASPLRGKLPGLPPAFVVTCEFDPLRDEGVAYAEALAVAGVPVEQIKARGHFHASFTMVDVVITGRRRPRGDGRRVAPVRWAST